MTREEQIIQESIKKYPIFPERRIGFIDGVQWEHKRLVEKACEWLDNINPDDYMDSGIFQIYDLIGNLRKAMEE